MAIDYFIIRGRFIKPILNVQNSTVHMLDKTGIGRAQSKILTCKVNVRTLDRVSELRAHLPYLFKLIVSVYNGGLSVITIQA